MLARPGSVRQGRFGVPPAGPRLPLGEPAGVPPSPAVVTLDLDERAVYELVRNAGTIPAGLLHVRTRLPEGRARRAAQRLEARPILVRMVEIGRLPEHARSGGRRRKRKAPRGEPASPGAVYGPAASGADARSGSTATAALVRLGDAMPPQRRPHRLAIAADLAGEGEQRSTLDGVLLAKPGRVVELRVARRWLRLGLRLAGADAASRSGREPKVAGDVADVSVGAPCEGGDRDDGQRRVGPARVEPAWCANDCVGGLAS